MFLNKSSSCELTSLPTPFHENVGTLDYFLSYPGTEQDFDEYIKSLLNLMQSNEQPLLFTAHGMEKINNELNPN